MLNLEFATTADIPAGIPAIEQCINAILVNASPSLCQILARLIDHDDETEQQGVGCQGLDTWIARQLCIQVSGCRILWRSRMILKPVVNKCFDFFGTEIEDFQFCKAAHMGTPIIAR